MSVEKKLISVIVPVFNVEQYVSKCIDSILKQNYSNLEIILVDDGSTDSSGKICDDYASKFEEIKTFHKTNGGLSSARNYGLKKATGKYIGFVDSDDTISPLMYERLMDNLQKTNSDISICGRYYVFLDHKPKVRYKEEKKLVKMNSKDAIKKMNSFNSFDMAAWDKLYKRELFENIKFPENKLSEDYFIMYKLFLKSNYICYTPEPLYNYMQRENSISHTSNINFDFIQASKEQMINVEKIYPDLIDILHTAYASANITVYDFYLKLGLKCRRNIEKKLQMNVQKNFIYIKKNKNLPLSKKIQAFLFVNGLMIYKVLFKTFYKVNKI